MYHIISYHIISYHIKLYHIISHYQKNAVINYSIRLFVVPVTNQMRVVTTHVASVLGTDDGYHVLQQAPLLSFIPSNCYGLYRSNMDGVYNRMNN